MDTVLPLLGFAVAATVTPGPNNVMLAANAANNGLRATVPHALGIVTGFTALLLALGFGFLGVVMQVPAVATGMRWVMFLWLLWLAWRIAGAPPPGHHAKGTGGGMGFVAATLFQWVNPKAWLLCLSAVSAWVAAGPQMTQRLALVAVVFALACMASSAVWAVMGLGAARVLATPLRLRVFNVSMALLLVLSLVPLLLHP